MARDGPTWRGRRPRACTETLCAGPGRPCIWPGRSQPGPHGEPARDTAVMHGCRESDSSIVPMKRLNNVEGRATMRSREQTKAAEAGEGREAGQGEDGRANQGPDTAPERPATCARPDTTGSAAGPREAADCALAPCLRYQPTPRGV